MEPTESTNASPANKRVIIGTAGHIDHGKSTLIETLTGVNPDRLAEEQKRGITIELGFAELPLPHNITAGIVDMPGHEKFIRQMIAGASGIDVALVCIAADDGMMPQTREHLAVLQLLDVRSCVIALTKCDLVDQDWIELVSEEIRQELQGGPFANAPLVPVSAHTHTGLDVLKEALSTCAQTIKHADTAQEVRMPVDRVFTIKGAGTVVTGTLWQGTIRPDDELEVLPQHQLVRVRGIQVHDHNVAASTTGTRTALNLAGVDRSDLQPGDFLASPHTLQESDRFDAQFTYLPVLSDSKPLVSGTSLRIAHGTRETLGRLLLMDGQETLEPYQSALAQIRLNAPLPLSHGDHFIVRLLSPARVIGGGSVLNPSPRRRTTLTEKDAQLLSALMEHDAANLCSAVVEAADAPVSLEEIKHITGLSAPEIDQALASLASPKNQPHYVRIATGKTTYVAPQSTIQKLVMTLENTLMKFHVTNPQETRISKGALQKLFPKHLDENVFDAILQCAAEQQKVLVSDGYVTHPEASSNARNLEEQTAQTLESLLMSYGTTPPTLQDLFAEAGVDANRGAKALALLESQGKAQRISKTLCFSREALDELWAAVRSYLEQEGQGTAAQLKEAMQTSRKYAIPLLEYFDNEKMTLRQEDVRILPKKKD